MSPWSAPNPLPPPITTDRTIVRPYQRGDGAALFAAVNAARDSVVPWLPWAKTDHLHLDDSIFRVETFGREDLKPDRLNVSLAVFDKNDEVLLGGVGFHRIDAKNGTGEVGYWIRGDRHGEGLCTEAVSQTVTAGFAEQEAGGWGFRRITLLCDANNRASTRIAEKLGMRLERHERAERFDEPRWRDLLGYAALASEWDSKNHRALPGIGWNPALVTDDGDR